MKEKKQSIRVSRSLLTIIIIFSMTTTSLFARTLDPVSVPVNPILLEKYEEFFPPSVIRVTEDVYVACGYNRDNPTLIIGTDGLIVVDPGESINAAEAAKAAKAAFNAELDNIFDKQAVKAVIYSHSHDCHIQGASVFADSETEIIAHEDLMDSLFDEWYGPSRIHLQKIMRAGIPATS